VSSQLAAVCRACEESRARLAFINGFDVGNGSQNGAEQCCWKYENMLCTVCCACDDASWTPCRCYKAIHQRLDLMLAKEGDGLRAGAERLCESDQEV
jgi:hypothetical protein